MNIVLLLGPSSAGKSTICHELEAQNWKVTGTDLILEQAETERFAKPLEEQGLYQELSGYMTPEDVILVCRSGKFNITAGDDPPAKHTFQFTSPDALEAKDFLIQAGVTDPVEIERLSTALRKVGQVYKEISAVPRPEDIILEEKLFNQAFDPSLDDDAHVVIDIIPESTPAKTIAMIKRFEDRAKQFKQDNPERSVNIIIVLAVCPINELSERIQKRNDEAEANNNPGNKRVGTFPFEQLTSLMQAKVQERNPIGNMHANMGEVSRDQVMSIAKNHKSPGTGSPIMKSKDGSERAVASKISIEDAVKISDNIEAKHLVSKFGAQDNQTAELAVVPGIKFDAIINTAEGTPKENTDKVVQAVENKLLDKKFHFFKG
jgi:deoxyadenosine/deoxycytidine kinase